MCDPTIQQLPKFCCFSATHQLWAGTRCTLGQRQGTVITIGNFYICSSLIDQHIFGDCKRFIFRPLKSRWKLSYWQICSDKMLHFPLKAKAARNKTFDCKPRSCLSLKSNLFMWVGNEIHEAHSAAIYTVDDVRFSLLNVQRSVDASCVVFNVQKIHIFHSPDQSGTLDNNFFFSSFFAKFLNQFFCKL